MKVVKTVVLSLLGLSLLIGTIAAIAPEQPATVSDSLKWHSIEELEGLAKKSDQKIIVDIYADWCRPCKMMDETTFNDPGLIQFLNTHYQLVKFNAEHKETINYRGKSYDFVQAGRRGYHQLAAQLVEGKLSYPSFVILNKDLEVEKIIKGYRDAEAFRVALDNAHLGYAR